MELYDAPVPFGPDQTYNRFLPPFIFHFIGIFYVEYLLIKESCERGSGKPTGSFDGPAELLFIVTDDSGESQRDRFRQKKRVVLA